VIRDVKTFQIPSLMQRGKNIGIWISPQAAHDKAIDKNRFPELLKTPPDGL
jgi:hypothetical protein